jgi:hypothetical protein
VTLDTTVTYTAGIPVTGSTVEKTSSWASKNKGSLSAIGGFLVAAVLGLLAAITKIRDAIGTARRRTQSIDCRTTRPSHLPLASEPQRRRPRRRGSLQDPQEHRAEVREAHWWRRNVAALVALPGIAKFSAPDPVSADRDRVHLVLRVRAVGGMTGHGNAERTPVVNGSTAGAHVQRGRRDDLARPSWMHRCSDGRRGVQVDVRPAEHRC